MDSIFCSNCGAGITLIPGKSKVFCSQCGMGIDVTPDVFPQEEPISGKPSFNPESEAPENNESIFSGVLQEEPETESFAQPPVQQSYATYEPAPQPPVQQGYATYEPAPQPPIQQGYPDYEPAPQPPVQQGYPAYGAPQAPAQQGYPAYGAPQPPAQQSYPNTENTGKKGSSKKPLIIIAVIVLLIAIAGAAYYLFLKPIYVESIKISKDDVNDEKNSIVLDVDESYELEYTISPVDYRYDEITWTSTDTNVATVENGVIKAVGQGECTIKVSTKKGVNSRIDITVEEIADKISLSKTSIEVNAGETAVISVSFDPQDTTDKHCTWESDDESVATVNDGIVTGVSEGTCTITVTSVYGPTAECTIKVTKPKPESFIIGTWEGYYADYENSSATFDSGKVLFVINSDGTAVQYIGDETFTNTWKYIKTDEDGDYVFYFYYNDGSKGTIYYLNSGNYAGQIQYAGDGIHVWYKKSTGAEA